MYAIENGLANNSKGIVRWFWKVMAILFAVFTAIATFGIGSTVQANAIATLSHKAIGISPIVVGGIVTILAAAVIMGGVKSIARCCQTLVPLMAGVYIAGCFAILFINSDFLIPAIKLIVENVVNSLLQIWELWLKSINKALCNFSQEHTSFAGWIKKFCIWISKKFLWQHIEHFVYHFWRCENLII